MNSELAKLVGAFSAAMICKLDRKAKQGWTGWDNPMLIDNLEKSLNEHVQVFNTTGNAKQLIDIANLAAFLWNLNGRPE